MIAAELLILRKRAATWILLAVWTLLGIFFAYVIPYALDPESDDITPFLPHALTGTLLEGFPFFGGVFALMLGVFALGSEYGWGTLKTLFTQGPSRSRVLAAKLAALGLGADPVRALPVRGRADREPRDRGDRGRAGDAAVRVAAGARARRRLADRSPSGPRSACCSASSRAARRSRSGSASSTRCSSKGC